MRRSILTVGFITLVFASACGGLPPDGSTESAQSSGSGNGTVTITYVFDATNSMHCTSGYHTECMKYCDTGSAPPCYVDKGDCKCTKNFPTALGSGLGECLDTSAAGNGVLWPCNGAASQSFWVGDTIMSNGKCLEVGTGSILNGVHLAACVAGSTSQAWKYDSATKALIGRGGYCLTTSAPPIFNGPATQPTLLMLTCNGSAGQQWIQQTNQRDCDIASFPSLSFTANGHAISAQYGTTASRPMITQIGNQFVQDKGGFPHVATITGLLPNTSYPYTIRGCSDILLKGSTSTLACGELGQPPCPDGGCRLTNHVAIDDNGLCQSCGSQGQICCTSGNVCEGSTACNSGRCEHCGLQDEHCCGGTCASGLACGKRINNVGSNWCEPPGAGGGGGCPVATLSTCVLGCPNGSHVTRYDMDPHCANATSGIPNSTWCAVDCGTFTQCGTTCPSGTSPSGSSSWSANCSPYQINTSDMTPNQQICH